MNNISQKSALHRGLEAARSCRAPFTDAASSSSPGRNTAPAQSPTTNHQDAPGSPPGRATPTLRKEIHAVDPAPSKSPLSPTTPRISDPHAVAPADGKSDDLLNQISEAVGFVTYGVCLVTACWDNPPALVVVGLCLLVKALLRWGGHLVPELASPRVRKGLAVADRVLSPLTTALATGEPLSRDTVMRVLLFVFLSEFQPHPADGHATNGGEYARRDSAIPIQSEEEAAPARPEQADRQKS